MKRIILSLTGLVTSLIIFSQTEFDALRIIQPDINGTARYSAMAGAFGALGGDASAIKDNPAGLGIYRRSEMAVTANTQLQSSSALWMGNEAIDGGFKFGFKQISYVLSSPTRSNASKSAGLIHSNWAFGYNRLKDYNRDLQIRGGNNASSSITDYMGYFANNYPGGWLIETNSYNPFNNTNVPWIAALAANAGLIEEYVDELGNTQYWASMLDIGEKVSPYYGMREQGFFDEYAITWSGNFNNRFFLGATLNIHEINYRADTEYKEAFGNGGNMNLMNTLRSSGNGVGFKIGGIYIPVDFMRFGFAVKAPTIYNMSEISYSDLYYNYGGNNYGTIYTPEGNNSYKFQSPLTYALSTSFIVGQKGLIGIEYNNSSNSTSKFMDLNNNSFNYRFENDSIRTLFNEQNTIKIGGEYKVTDKLALRAGYAYSGPAALNRIAKEMIPNTIRTDVEYFVNNNTKYLTAGFGYRENNWFFDFAVMNKTISESFYPYNSNKLSSSLAVSPASVNTSYLSIIASMGIRF